MQDTSTVAIVAMLASMAAVTNQAYASPWVPDLKIRAEPSEESSAKPEETKKDESKKEEPTSSEKKNDPSPSSKADDKPTSFANAKPTSSSEPKDKSSSEKKPEPTSSSKKAEPTSSKKDDNKSSSSKDNSSSSTSSHHGFVAPATETPSSSGSSTGSSASSSSSSGFVESGNKQSESSGMSGGAVAGVVIAVLVGVAAIAGFVILRKRRAQAARNRAQLKPDPFTMGFGSHDPPPPHTAYNMASTTPSPMIQMPTLGAGAAAVGAAGAYAAATHNNDNNNTYGAQLHDAPYGGTQLQDNSPGYSAYNTHQPYTQDPAAYNTNMQDYNNTGMQQQPATYDYGNTAPALSVNQAAPGTAVSDAPPSLSPIPTHTDAFSPAMATTAAAATGAAATAGVATAAAATTTTTAPSTSPMTTPATPATAQPSANSLGVFTVISTYTPTLSDELDIQPGDQVEVLVEYDDGWCQGVNLSRGGAKGVFPRHCCHEQANSSVNEQSMKRVSSMIVDQQQQPQQ